MYRPHSSKKKAKTRSYDLIVTQHPNGALSAKLEEENVDPDNLNPVDGPIGSPNGRTSEHGFFTTLGLAIGEQFKKA
jgi:hypothetical protein